MGLFSGVAAAQPVPEECARPANWAERTLCADSELMALHLQLQRVYNDRRALLEGEAFLDMVSYHHGWLRGREECRTAPDSAGQLSCLRDLYQARISQLSGKPAAPAPEPPRAAPDPTLVACRGEGTDWVMELGAYSARLRLGSDQPVQSMKGRMTSVPKARTSAWRGRESGAEEDTVVMMLEGACTIEGSASRFPLMGRLSLPDGSLLTGCCLRTPVAVMQEPGPAPGGGDPLRAAPGSALLSTGTPVRLRDVDGPNVALRKSARISSGNILLRVRAGSVATIEQATIREGTSWYFIALRDGDTRGWIMGDLVEPLVAVAVKGGATAEPVAPRIPPAVPVPEAEPEAEAEAQSDRGGATRDEGFQGAMASVGRQWWTNVLQHLPVIDACIERARLRNARIVRIEAEGAATRNVYLRDGLKSRLVCVVRKGQAVRARVLDRDDIFPQGAGPMFTRAPSQPPAASCYRNQRVRVPATREVVGWLSTLKPGRRCK